MFTDAVTIAFGVFDAVAAYEAEVAVAAVEANEADNAYDAEATLPVKNEAVEANDADVAIEEVAA